MNVSHLNLAIDVHKFQSFSAAAKHRNLSQPSLSSAINQIEKQLGGRLFERSTRKVETTAFGLHMIPFFEEVVEAQRTVETQARSFYEPDVKVARIAFAPQLQSKAIAERLTGLQRSDPNIEFGYKQCFLDDADRRLLANQIDIVISPAIPNQNEIEGVERVFFSREPILVLQADGSSLKTSDGSIEIEQLSEQTVALTYASCGLAPFTRSLFEQANVALRTYRGEALNYQALEEWAELGLATVLLPESCISDAGMTRALPLRHQGTVANITYIQRRLQNSSRPSFLNKVYKTLQG